MEPSPRSKRGKGIKAEYIGIAMKDFFRTLTVDEVSTIVEFSGEEIENMNKIKSRKNL